MVQDLQQNRNGTGPSRRRDDDRRPPSKGQGTGPTATRKARAGRRHGEGWSARNQVRDVLETAWVRCIKIRRTTGTAQLLRRGGETTASDFTKAKDPSGRKKVRHPQRQLTLVLQDNAAGRETDDFTGPHPAWVKASRRRLWRARCSFSPEFKKIRDGRLANPTPKGQAVVVRGSGRPGQQERSVTTGSSRLTPLGRGGNTTVCGASETAERLPQGHQAMCSGGAIQSGRSWPEPSFKGSFLRSVWKDDGQQAHRDT
ncbi:hypothetical protein CF319_g8318 [Tilletia indica]|nr:hypothetical protein CF319_g8318 [Tilletia indica]